MTNDTLTAPAGVKATRGSFLLVTCLVLLLSACASLPAVPKADWITDSVGWEVRDVDASEAPRWVLYERDASVANVKELRIVGVVGAEPEAVARALRHRLLDDTTLPKSVKRTLLRESQTEVEYYGFNAMPFPFQDREVYERLRFTQDARTGVHTVNVTNFEPGDPAKRGVLRIPVVRNTFVIAPVGAGRSAVTIDTVHDLGGHFPNWAIYGPVANRLVNELAALSELTAPPKNALDVPPPPRESWRLQLLRRRSHDNEAQEVLAQECGASGSNGAMLGGDTVRIDPGCCGAETIALAHGIVGGCARRRT